jgi:hypothetical protein
MTYEDEGCSEMLAQKIQTRGESPKRKNTTFTTQLKCGIERGKFCSLAMPLRCMQIHILLTLGEDKGE